MKLYSIKERKIFFMKRSHLESKWIDYKKENKISLFKKILIKLNRRKNNVSKII